MPHSPLHKGTALVASLPISSNGSDAIHPSSNLNAVHVRLLPTMARHRGRATQRGSSRTKKEDMFAGGQQRAFVSPDWRHRASRFAIFPAVGDSCNILKRCPVVCSEICGARGVPYHKKANISSICSHEYPDLGIGNQKEIKAYDEATRNQTFIFCASRHECMHS